MEENLTDQQIQEFEALLLSKVPTEGNRGNVSLVNELGWTWDRYWLIRNRLVDNGQLEKGKGRGGSVSRVVDEPAEGLPETTVATKAVETDYYASLLKVIQTDWSKDSRVDQIQAEITGLQGSRSTGKWARPDITAILYRTFPYVPGKHIETVVFEVKPEWAVDVTAVYEALAHRRAANRAYVIFVHKDPSTISTILDDIYAEARRVGVGVILARDPANYEEWDVEVEAARFDPEPERLNDFLARQVSQGMRETLMKWFK